MNEWIDSMKRTLLAVQRFGGETEPLVIAPPASEQEVASVEAALGMAVPASLRRVLTEFSACVNLRWELPDPTGLPEELRQIGIGYLAWDIGTITNLYAAYRKWIEICFSNVHDAYDRVWHDKFPVLDVRNGDFIAIVTEGTDAGAVTFLCHDGDDFHGARLADDFEDFLNRYIALGCAGPDGWTLDVFAGDLNLGLQTDCSNAKLWRACLYGSDPPSQADLDAFQIHRVATRQKTEHERAVETLETSTDPSTILGIYSAHPDLAVDAGIEEIYRLLAVDTSRPGQYACMALAAFGDASVLDWIEDNVPPLVTSDWGALAAVSDFSWERATAWLRSGRPISLVALDALKESAKTGTIEWPPYEEVELGLSDYLANDGAPRVKQAINFVLSSLRGTGTR